MWKAIENEVEENKYLIDELEGELIKKRMDTCLKWYTKKAVKNKYYYYILSSLAIVAPVIAEIVLLCPMEMCYIKIITGIFAGVSSVSVAFLSLFEVREKWRIYRNQVEMIKSKLSICIGEGKISESELLKELEDSMMETHETWMEIFKKEKKKITEEQ